MTTPFAVFPDAELYLGDCRHILAALPAESVACIVTSPPYHALRDYGGLPPTVWGGCPACSHTWATETVRKKSYRGDSDASTLHGPRRRDHSIQSRATTCTLCGAWRGVLGLEPTLDCLGWARGLSWSACPQGCYVCHMREVGASFWRVLREHGTAWLNLGDSYAAKNLQLQPAHIALALQADGWLVRSHIVWHKSDAMPESVTDRPTCAHDTIWLLARSERYVYDAAAVRERSVSDRGSGNGFRTGHPADPRSSDSRARDDQRQWHLQPLRAMRNVWTMSTFSADVDHAAVFPDALPRRAILAGCPEGGVVLDPFVGSGTTLLVARALGRRSIGIEASPTYAALARRRLEAMTLPLDFGGDQSATAGVQEALALDDGEASFGEACHGVLRPGQARRARARHDADEGRAGTLWVPPGAVGSGLAGLGSARRG